MIIRSILVNRGQNQLFKRIQNENVQIEFTIKRRF